MTGDFALLDCTLRDGGYINGWEFSRELACTLYQASAAGGTDIFELGYLSDDPEAPLCRRCPPAFAKQLRALHPGPRLAAMLEADTAGMAPGTPEESGIDILRIALNRDKVAACLPKAAEYRRQGYQVFIQLMGITGYTDDQLITTVQMIEAQNCADCISIGDSYGSLLPDQTARLVRLIKAHTTRKVGLHAHNNMQLGMANVLAALDAGAQVVDGSLYGMGRGGGNVPLELLITYFEKQWPERFHALPVLECIDRHMLRLAREHPWGYSLSALLSGVYECHPYYTSRLIEKREYTIGQVLRAAQMAGDADVVGFRPELLQAIIESGFSREKLDAERQAETYFRSAPQPQYLNAHPGRPFLVLGNGPTLVSQRDRIDEYVARFHPVVLGANRLDGPAPDYHAFNNQRRFEQYGHQVSPKSKLLLGPSIQTGAETGHYLKLECLNLSSTPLQIRGGAISANCRSIGVLLGAVALVMGAGSIAFAGMDGYELAGEKLYYPEEESSFAEDLLEKQTANQNYLTQLSALAQARQVPVFTLTDSSYQF